MPVNDVQLAPPRTSSTATSPRASSSSILPPTVLTVYNKVDWERMSVGYVVGPP